MKSNRQLISKNEEKFRPKCKYLNQELKGAPGYCNSNRALKRAPFSICLWIFGHHWSLYPINNILFNFVHSKLLQIVVKTETVPERVVEVHPDDPFLDMEILTLSLETFSTWSQIMFHIPHQKLAIAWKVAASRETSSKSLKIANFSIIRRLTCPHLLSDLLPGGIDPLFWD